MLSSVRSVRKPSSPLIHADQRHLVQRQGARDVQHGAIAAQHDRQIRHAAYLIQIHGLVGAVLETLGAQAVHHHGQAPG